MVLLYTGSTTARRTYADACVCDRGITFENHRHILSRSAFKEV